MLLPVSVFRVLSCAFTRGRSREPVITVVNVDRPPVLAAIGDQTVDATKPLSFVLSATDPDGESLTYSADTLPSGAALTGQTFAWTPASSQAGTYPVTFTVSDGQLTDSETVSITVASSPTDQIAPAVVQSLPAPDAIQVPLNNLVTLHVTDANAGVDANSVVIRVDGSVVYQGNVDAYTSPTGRCSRSGTKNDYRFIYQPNAMFGFDQTVAVRVNAADLAGNVMSEYQVLVHDGDAGLRQEQVGQHRSGGTPTVAGDGTRSCRNPLGGLARRPVNNRDIYVAKLPAGSSCFPDAHSAHSDTRDQCNPDLAVSAAGAVYVVWQDNRNGNWDIYASISSDGGSSPRRCASRTPPATRSIPHRHRSPDAGLRLRGLAGRPQRQPGHLRGQFHECLRHVHCDAGNKQHRRSDRSRPWRSTAATSRTFSGRT